MLLYFLRLFVPFRELEVQLADARLAVEEANEARDVAVMERDRFIALLENKDSDAEYLRKLVDETLLSEREAYSRERATYQMAINHSIQRLGGTAPYPEANTLPESATPRLQTLGPIGRAARELPSQIVARNTRNMINRVIKSKGIA